MKILITGGLGVNGSWVTTKFVERGFHPVVLENRLDFSLISEEVRRNATFVQGDITDAELVLAMLREHGITKIVHMAALVTGLHEDPLGAFRVNALATVQLLDAAVTAGVQRFVFTSSRAVYGNVTGVCAHPTYRPISEDDRLNAATIYDVCKVASEGMGRNVAVAKGIEFVALRFAQIYGPGKLVRHGNFSVLSRMIEDSLSNKPVHIPDGGDQRDDIIYVDDVAEAVVVATLHEKPRFPAYNISHGVGLTLHDFASAVREVVPDAQIEIGPGLDYMKVGVQYYGALDNTRAREDLGFVPRFGLVEGVTDYARRLRELGFAPLNAKS